MATLSALAALSLSAAACSSSKDSEQDSRLTTPDGGGGAGGTEAGVKGPRLVVTTDWLNGSLSLLDYDKLIGGATTRDDALVDTVDLSKYLPGPLEVAITPDGKTAVVTVGPGFFAGGLGGLIGATNVDPGGTLLLVDLATRKVTAELPPPAGPMGIVITPDGKTAFSVDHGDTEGKTMSVIDLVEKKLVESIVIAGGPEEAAIREDGKLGVVNSDGDGSVRFFDPRDPSHTLSAPLVIGGDADATAFVSVAKKVVIAQSLDDARGKAGYSVIDIADESAPKVIESAKLPGIPYGSDVIPGTTHVLVTSGVSACVLSEIDVGVTPSAIVRTIELPCEKPSLPLSTGIDGDGKHAFVGVPGDNSLMVVDLVSGKVTRIPWLEKAGPMHVAVGP